MPQEVGTIQKFSKMPVKSYEPPHMWSNDLWIDLEQNRKPCSLHYLNRRYRELIGFAIQSMKFCFPRRTSRY